MSLKSATQQLVFPALFLAQGLMPNGANAEVTIDANGVVSDISDKVDRRPQVAYMQDGSVALVTFSHEYGDGAGDFYLTIFNETLTEVIVQPTVVYGSEDNDLGSLDLVQAANGDLVLSTYDTDAGFPAIADAEADGLKLHFIDTQTMAVDTVRADTVEELYTRYSSDTPFVAYHSNGNATVFYRGFTNSDFSTFATTLDSSGNVISGPTGLDLGTVYPYRRLDFAQDGNKVYGLFSRLSPGYEQMKRFSYDLTDQTLSEETVFNDGADNAEYRLLPTDPSRVIFNRMESYAKLGEPNLINIYAGSVETDATLATSVGIENFWIYQVKPVTADKSVLTLYGLAPNDKSFSYAILSSDGQMVSPEQKISAALWTGADVVQPPRGVSRATEQLSDMIYSGADVDVHPNGTDLIIAVSESENGGYEDSYIRLTKENPAALSSAVQNFMEFGGRGEQ